MQAKLESIVDALPSLVAYIDADHRYQFVNAAYERWFGRPRAELVGKHIEEVLGVEGYRAILHHIERALAGHTITYEAEVAHRDGGTRSIEATFAPQRAADGTIIGYVSLVSDVGERKAFEQLGEAAVERTERLLKITAALAEAVTPTEVFAAAVDHVAAAVGASSAGLWIMSEDGAIAQLVRSLGYLEPTRQRLDGLRLDESASPVVDCLRRGEPIWVASQADLLRHYPHLGAMVTAGRSYRVSCLPLIARGRTLGALGLTIEEARETSADERSFLMLVASYTSQALERLRLLEAERRSRDEALAAAARMEILSRASRTFVAASLELPSTLDGITSEIAAVLGSCVVVNLIHADGRLHAASVHHPDPEIRARVQALTKEFPLELGSGLTGTVASTGHSVLMPTVDPVAILEHTAPPFRAFVEQNPPYAIMCTPLRTQGRVLGTIMTSRVRPGQAYAPEDLRLLEELSERAAAAIDNSRLYHEVVDARARAEQLLAELHETVRYSETFAGILAHDLRNPLGAMMTAAQVLLRRQEGVGDRITKPLSRILSSGERMTRMIEQLLDLTRARVGGGIELHPQEASLAELCTHVMDELELVYPEWQLQREVHGDPSGTWDPDRLLQVVSNLVANAGMHGTTGGVIAVRIDGTSPEVVTLEIHNDGAIPEALLPSIFDPFRGTRHRGDQSRGLGLGLFITQQIVQAHGGTIELRSTPADGTTFLVRLPRRASGKNGPVRA